MTKTEARSLISSHLRNLDAMLTKATSQFQIRMCYVSAHEDMVDLGRKIIDEFVG